MEKEETLLRKRLIELSKVAKEWKKKTYLDAAVRMLKALDEKS
jgi:hypothetical protein